MEKLRQENLELIRKLGSQEEALCCSNRHLEQRSSECQALSRQLEAALFDVKQQVQCYSIASSWPLVSWCQTSPYHNPGQQGQRASRFQRRGPSDQNPGAGSREKPAGQWNEAPSSEQTHGNIILERSDRTEFTDAVVGVLNLGNCAAVFKPAGWEAVWSASEGPAAESGPIGEPQTERSELRRLPQTVLHNCVRRRAASVKIRILVLSEIRFVCSFV